MKKGVFILLCFSFTGLMALSLGEEKQVTKKSSRLEKIKQRDSDRNNISKQQYKIEQYKIREDKNISFKEKKRVEKKKTEYIPPKLKRVFTPRLYLNQDTAMQRIASYYYKDKKYLYGYGIMYLMNDKQIGGTEDIERILNSNDGYLNFYETLVKVFYQAYYEEKYNKILLNRIELLYNKLYTELKDTVSGFLIEDILLSMGITHPESPLVSSIGYCFTLEDKKMRFACRMNQIQKYCLEGRKELCNELKVEEQLNGVEAERYLNTNLKTLKQKNIELKKEFDLKYSK